MTKSPTGPKPSQMFARTLAGLTLALTVAACGSNDRSAPPSRPSPAPTATAIPAPSPVVTFVVNARPGETRTVTADNGTPVEVTFLEQYYAASRQICRRYIERAISAQPGSHDIRSAVLCRLPSGDWEQVNL